MSMTHRRRMLAAARGELPDALPYAPRIDLWYNANARAGSLPERHRGRTADEIALAEGWALHKVVPDHLRQPDPEAMLHRGLGVHALKEYVVGFVFREEVDIRVTREGDRTEVRYTTPEGTLSCVTVHSEEMRRGGTSLPWIEKPLIRRPEDYAVAASIFERMDAVPAYERFEAYQAEVGESGLPVTGFTVAAGPIHHIQKYLLDATEFFYHYRDHHREMRFLADAIAPLYDKAIRIIADSPAEITNWGSNFDDMITYPPFFEKELLPWIRKGADVFREKGILTLCHTDGENLGLMDLIHESGIDVAEAVCPHPMTKVGIGAYYRRWSDRITIFGGVPSNLLLPRTTSREELERFMEELFEAVAPGKRFILGIADTTPRDAEFERLVRIGEMARERGSLPLKAGAFRPVAREEMARASARAAPEESFDESFRTVRDDVVKGKEKEILDHVRGMLDRGVRADDIVQKGMIAAMEVIGRKFKIGAVYIPEVLLSARAMNRAVEYLAPFFAKGERTFRGKVLIGSVRGDLHDIGKNMVAAMLRGAGFEVIDAGINVAAEVFLRHIEAHRPHLLGLSSLLTTTMPEMGKLIEALERRGFRGNVRVMVGGAPVNARFAREIGADGYGRDAGEAVEKAKELVSGEMT